MLSSPPLVDSLGNINLHFRDDLIVTIQPSEGMPSLASRDLIFEIPARDINVSLIAHPDGATWALLKIPTESLRTVRSQDSFALIDVTDGGSSVRWEGVFIRRGQ